MIVYLEARFVNKNSIFYYTDSAERYYFSPQTLPLLHLSSRNTANYLHTVPIILILLLPSNFVLSFIVLKIPHVAFSQRNVSSVFSGSETSSHGNSPHPRY